MLHTEIIACLELLLEKDRGTYCQPPWRSTEPVPELGFLRPDEREALCYALGVLRAHTPDDNPF
jgi:hypothetical protein